MKIRSKVGFGLLSSAMCVAALAHAQEYTKNKQVPQSVTFKTSAAKGTIHINGSVPGLAIAQTEGDFIVLKADLNKMVMGDPKDQGKMDKQRAEHARKELHTEQHPMATLKVDKNSVTADGSAKTGRGTFSLNGKSQEIKFKYTAVESGKNVKVTGSFPISLKKHGIEEICLSVTGVCVADAVSVDAAFTLIKTP